MKIFGTILMLLLVSSPVFAQNSRKAAIKNKMWNSNDKDFELTEVKEKWKNESAVILCKSIDYEVRKMVMVSAIQENLYTRERIKLLDKAAVAEYSELTFDKKRSYQLSSSGSVYVGIKVIKPDGTENELDLNDAITMEISEGYRKSNYKKIAVPDLEPGDIIDYYYCTETEHYNSIFEVFSPVFYVLASSHPIHKQKLNLHIMRKCYLNMKPMNGAPEPVLDFNKKKGDYNYQLVDEDREKMDEDRWSYVYRSFPILKFQAYFTTPKGMKYNKGYSNFLGKEGIAKTSVSDAELIRYYYTVNPNLYMGTDAIKVFMQKNFKKEKNKEKIVKEAYYCFRNREYRIGFEGDKVFLKNYKYGVSDWNFTKNMSLFLSRMKIDHDIVYTVRKDVGDISDLVLPDELSMLIYVKTPEPFYMANFTRFSNYKDIPDQFQGNNALHLNVMAKKRQEVKITKAKIPMVASTENADKNFMEIEFDGEDPSQIKVKRSFNTKGFNKHHAHRLYVNNYDYILNSRNDKYKNELLENQKLGKKEKAETLSKIDLRKSQDKKDREERIKSDIESNFGAKLISYDALELKEIGMWPEEQELNVRDSFVLEGLVSKVGQNYLVEAGKLISRQVEIHKTELDRKSDIYLPVARTFEYNVSILVPEGYAPQGIENFNIEVTNNTGGFVSTATLEGSKVVIKTRKYYNSNEVQVSDWPKMVEFLDAAYAFTQQKLLLRKVNIQ